MTHSSTLDTARSLQSGGGFLSRRRRPWLIYTVSLLMPMVIMGIIWAFAKVIPFGKNMILAHDQWHQYYPFYLDLRIRLREGSSLFHSWTTGMGTSYLPLFAYYLASPLNYVAALLPESMAMVYYTFTVLLRIGLAGLFFAYFLKKTFDRCELTVPFFSTMYALCSFIMGYYWNAIWLDTIALLPLVVLGALSLLKEGRYTLYVVSLALSIYCSYYIGLFTCVFVLLIFICWHVVNWDDLGGFGIRLLKFAFFSLVAIGLTAFLTLPTYLAMQSTSSAVNKFPEDNALNIVKGQSYYSNHIIERLSEGKAGELFSFFRQKAPAFTETKTVRAQWTGLSGALRLLRLGHTKDFFRSFRLPLQGIRDILGRTADGTTPTSMEGLPNVACGFSTLILALLYLFCKKVPLRERICAVLLLLFFSISFLLRTLDYIWHGMHFPNMLPHRFSFLWCFVVIYMAFRAYTLLETVRWWRMLPVLGSVILVLVCVVAGNRHVTRVLLPTMLVAAAILLLLSLYSLRIIRKPLLLWALCGCMLCEAVLGAILGVAQVGTTDSSYYPTKAKDTRAVIAMMQEREADTVDLWRAEVAAKQSLNDSTLLGYNGVSCFSSAANSNTSRYLQSLGLAASVPGNRYVYQEADPFTNILLGVKYLIDRNGRCTDPTWFEEVGRSNSVVLLENQAYLPMGYVVGENTTDYVPEVGTLPFDQLNRLFRLMTGLEQPLYTPLRAEKVEVLGDVRITGQTSSYFNATTTASDEQNCVQVSFRMPENGHLCVYSKSSNAKDVVYYLNGSRQFTYSDKYGYNRYMGYFRKGDLISLRFLRNVGTGYYAYFGAALFDGDLFDTAYETLSRHTLIPTLVTDTRIEGAIRLEEAGLVYTTIPYNNGWTLTVDGEPAKITPVGDAMIAFQLEPGVHSIRLEFEAPGFATGLKISLVCAGILLLLVILALLARFGRPPIVKVKMKLADPRKGEEDLEPEAAEFPPEPGDPIPAPGMPPLDPHTGPIPPAIPGPASDPESDLDQRIAALLPETGEPARGPAAPQLPSVPGVPPAPPASNREAFRPAPSLGAPAAAAPEAPASVGFFRPSPDFSEPGARTAPIPRITPSTPAPAPDKMLAGTQILPDTGAPAPLPPAPPEEVYSREDLDALLKGLPRE